ncbi:hypothetical protein Btru_068882 [Bulinus truncatus]|nr:hypothetical protein Btru_068882 [Bulinus truncatus]
MANITAIDSAHMDIHLNSNRESEPQKTVSHRNSKAIPTQTLFGTVLEKVDYSSLKNITGKYIIEGNITKTPERYPLPVHLQKKLPGREQVELSRKELINQKKALDEAEQNLKSKAERALIFKEFQTNENSSDSSLTYCPSWISPKDLEHSREINCIGLNERGSYNRDKYGHKPIRHTYNLIGDLFASNMDFKASNTANNTVNNSTIWSRGRHLPYKLMKQNAPPNDVSKSLVRLPPNIRHKFGSKECDFLLSDENLVRMTLEKNSVIDRPQRPSKKDTVECLPVDMTGNYGSLGHVTRANIFPGMTIDHKISNTKQDFNDLVYLRRVPNPDQFRYQSDELSKWSEHNVLRERMKKAWNEKHPLGSQK